MVTKERAEIRRTAHGSVYWLRRAGGLWVVTADSVPITSPAEYAAAFASLDAVTA